MSNDAPESRPETRRRRRDAQPVGPAPLPIADAARTSASGSLHHPTSQTQ